MELEDWGKLRMAGFFAVIGLLPAGLGVMAWLNIPVGAAIAMLCGMYSCAYILLSIYVPTVMDVYIKHHGLRKRQGLR